MKILKRLSDRVLVALGDAISVLAEGVHELVVSRDQVDDAVRKDHESPRDEQVTVPDVVLSTTAKQMLADGARPTPQEPDAEEKPLRGSARARMKRST